jgi:2-methylcitrate dehydratase PrpD
VVRDDLTARYPAAWPARVAITLADGVVLRGASDYPRGNPENPITTAALERKMTDLVASRFGPAVAQQLLDAVRGIDTCDDMASAVRDIALTGGERAT